MKRQVEMEETMIRAHREFTEQLAKSLELVSQEIDEAGEMANSCTDEWCQATEGAIDELAKMIFSISEPRWLPAEESHKISNLRCRVHDLYARYKAVKK